MKFALLIGINYIGTSSSLNGCINDVKNVEAYLKNVHNFESKNMIIMHDELDKSSGRYPTRKNILEKMEKMANKITRGDTLFVHYSGHGGSLKQSIFKQLFIGDEEDGVDETIYPVDFNELGGGIILDDDLRRILIDKLPQGSKFRGLFDCCRSGTVLDCRFNYSVRGDALSQSKNKRINKSECDAKVISGCRDDQTSADASFEGKSAGALTHVFLKYTQSLGPEVSCEELLVAINKYLKNHNFTQRPQLSSGQKCSPENKFFDF